MPKHRQDGGPDAHKEEEDESEEGTRGRIGRGEEIDPIAAVRGGEEEVLEEDGDEEPEDDAAFHDGVVEGRDAPGRLAVIVRQAKVDG